MEDVFAHTEGVQVLPEDGVVRGAVLVLSGSSGRVEAQRCRLLSEIGFAAMSIRWFGGRGQPPGICEVALETFGPALDRLARLSENLVVIGSSKGAEAALLLASRDVRIRTVVGFSPTSVVWANVGPGRDGLDRPQRSSWTVAGAPLPYVPYDDGWHRETSAEHPAFRGLYEQSWRTFADRIAEAEIPVERIAGRVVVTAGGDDRVWPADRFARGIARRRADHGLDTTVLTDPDAGHRVILPRENPREHGGRRMARGGSAAADARFGQRIWLELTAISRG